MDDLLRLSLLLLLPVGVALALRALARGCNAAAPPSSAAREDALRAAADNPGR